MKKELKGKVDLFLENVKKIKNEFKFDSEDNYLLSSFLYTDINKEVDINKMQDCYKLFKVNTGFFSDYSLLTLLIVTKMSLQKDPLEYFNELDNNLKRIRKQKIFNSVYNILSAMILCNFKNNSFDKTIEKENNIYKLMRDKHPFLTDMEDIPFAFLLALSDKKESEIMEEMEKCYDLLNDNIKFYNNEVYTMAQVLTVSDKKIKDKVNKVIEIYNLLRENKKGINKSFGLPILATLAFVDKKPKELIEDIIEVDNYLGCQKGTGLWPYGKATRLLFSMLLVESLYQNNKTNSVKNVALISTIITEDVITALIILNLVILMD